eukprot:CAMPEP_0182444580 /NCGR_PEP_ID=MMETSP1172-20130603/2987_1 /TAXON_ID=708627 /ORGANISM="Timspurckia oligopyrenoides, Strain CCMP3278" /LENGTH=472 /DNA_ID=CAMNT_0024640173 /DNA_START=123 /DNA_END=1539 /DNA_ORIENTATION=+
MEFKLKSWMIGGWILLLVIVSCIRESSNPRSSESNRVNSLSSSSSRLMKFEKPFYTSTQLGSAAAFLSRTDANDIIVQNNLPSVSVPKLQSHHENTFTLSGWYERMIEELELDPKRNRIPDAVELHERFCSGPAYEMPGSSAHSNGPYCMKDSSSVYVENARALVLNFVPNRNPTHQVGEFIPQLAIFARHCEMVSQVQNNQELFVILSVYNNWNQRTRWFQTVILMIMERIAGSSDRVLINWKGAYADKPVTYANGTVFEYPSGDVLLIILGFIREVMDLGVQFTMRYTFVLNSFGRSKFHMRQKKLSEYTKNAYQIPSDFVLRESSKLVMDALRHSELQPWIKTRYNPNEPLVLTGSKSERILTLAKVLTKRAAIEGRKINVLIYDRMNETESERLRVWQNGHELADVLSFKPYSELFEVTYLSKMPDPVEAQSEVFCSDVVVSVHGGHMGNLVFSTNTLVLEAQADPRW